MPTHRLEADCFLCTIRAGEFHASNCRTTCCIVYGNFFIGELKNDSSDMIYDLGCGEIKTNIYQLHNIRSKGTITMTKRLNISSGVKWEDIID